MCCYVTREGAVRSVPCLACVAVSCETMADFATNSFTHGTALVSACVSMAGAAYVLWAVRTQRHCFVTLKCPRMHTPMALLLALAQSYVPAQLACVELARGVWLLTTHAYLLVREGEGATDEQLATEPACEALALVGAMGAVALVGTAGEVVVGVVGAVHVLCLLLLCP